MRRTWLLGRISGYLQFQRRRVEEILSLDDQVLIHLWQKRVHDRLAVEYADFSACHAEAARARAEAARLELICACEPSYPRSLRRLRTPPAVLHVAGGLERFLELAGADPVAIVGTREPTGYGTQVAETLGRGISVCGLSVVSGMALGVDGAAHRGALAGSGRTVAVLPGCASEPYPNQHRQLHGQVLRHGVAVSEFGPGTSVRKWTFVARNRVIAALSRMTIVVQGRKRSGALLTADAAKRCGRAVGAVPGQVGVPQSAGPHQLLRDGAVMIQGPQDVLDAVFGAGVRAVAEAERAALAPRQRALLEAIVAGADTIAALTRTGVAAGELLQGLAELEMAGCVRREAGGKYIALG
jgi:DNA processing protein